jgi:hypothetical protein
VDEGVKKGLYSEYEAVNYFGLADPDRAVPFIRPYLDKGSAEAQSAASGYLGANKTTQALVRDQVLLNDNAPTMARASASKVLSQYDPQYTTYAMGIATNPKTPPIVSSSVIEGYVRQLEAKGQLFSAKEAISNFQASRPDVDVKSVVERLNRM